jgi:hypothetical protein
MASGDEDDSQGTGGAPKPAYVRPPRSLKAFPGAYRVPSKTRRQGGGLRHRWKDNAGTIFEWDYQHGRVEKYNWLGHHLGEFDPDTGAQTKPASNRRIEP